MMYMEFLVIMLHKFLLGLLSGYIRIHLFHMCWNGLSVNMMDRRALFFKKKMAGALPCHIRRIL